MEVLLGLLIVIAVVIAVLLFISHRMAPHRGNMTPRDAGNDATNWGSGTGGM